MFKNFRKRAAGKPLVLTAADCVQQLIAVLEADKHAAASVPVTLRIRIQELLPVEIKQRLLDRFEFDLACAIAQQMQRDLTKKFGLLESRWPNMHQHVIGYRDLLRMLEEYVEEHPEVENAMA